MSQLKNSETDQFRLGDNYQTEEFIGSGSIGVIFKAIDLNSNQTVALKIINDEYSNNPKFISCMNTELKPILQLEHENIVQIKNSGENNNKHYIVMEYVSGNSLDKIIEEKKFLDIDFSVMILKKIASGLDYASNKKIIHKALKPEDILISDDNEVKITGFGLSKAIATTWLTMTGTSPGHVEYMSPEQAEGENVDHRTDIYSLGIIAYKMLTGEVPFKKQGVSILSLAMKHINEIPERPSLKKHDIPIWLENIIMKCLEKNPDNRFQSGNELLSALENEDEINRDIIKHIIETKEPESENEIDSDELSNVISNGFADFNLENVKEIINEKRQKDALYVTGKIDEYELRQTLTENRVEEINEKQKIVVKNNSRLKILLGVVILLEIIIISLLAYIFINM